MKLRESSIKGVYEIELFHHKDERGSFTKTFLGEFFKDLGLQDVYRESFYSTNREKVIRGMHYQCPPDDHEKLIYLTRGRALDVVLDIRTKSDSYGKYVNFEISGERPTAIYMPAGVAHGFCCLEETTMVYMTSTQYHPPSDKGIRWDSFGMDWPVSDPIMSERDRNFISFAELNSPF